MYRRACGLSVILLVALSACEYTEPAVDLPGPATPILSTAPAVLPTSTAFTVDGVGPYRIGGDFNLLRTQGRLASLVIGSQACGDSHRSAHGVPPYQDIWLAAKGPSAEIYIVVNGSATLATPSGAKVGSTLSELRAIYGQAGEEITYKTRAAYLVKSPSGNGLLFDFDVNTKKVIAVIAGNAAYLKESFLFEADYC